MSTRGSVRDAVERELGVGRVPADRAAVELDVAVGDRPDQAGQRRQERLHGRRARLGQRRRAVNPVVDDHEHAAAGRVLVGRHGDGVVEVQRPVGRQRRRGTHRRGQDDRLARLDDQVEEVGRLLDGVGAVRDHHAGDVGHRGQLVDARASFSQTSSFMSCEPMFEICSPRSVGELLGLRHGGEQLLHADLPGRVAGLHVAGGRAGDGAAGREHDDGGERRAGGRGLSQMPRRTRRRRARTRRAQERRRAVVVADVSHDEPFDWPWTASSQDEPEPGRSDHDVDEHGARRCDRAEAVEIAAATGIRCRQRAGSRSIPAA